MFAIGGSETSQVKNFEFKVAMAEANFLMIGIKIYKAGPPLRLF